MPNGGSLSQRERVRERESGSLCRNISLLTHR
jgi:hypothetical protein